MDAGCQARCCGHVIRSSEYGAARHAMEVRHDLEAMLWFAMLWAQDVAQWKWCTMQSLGSDG